MPISKQFVLTGHATFTISSPDGTHRTYKVDKVEASAKWPEAYFVKTLVGPQNTDDYAYMGKLDPHTGQVTTTAKSTMWAKTVQLRVLNRVLARVWSDDHAAYQQHGYEVQHAGSCGRCGRLLTVPESITTGIGPECAKMMGIPMSKTPKPKKAKTEKVASTAATGGIPDYLPPETGRKQPEKEDTLSVFASDVPEVDTRTLTPHYTRENEVSHWTGYYLGSPVIVYND